MRRQIEDGESELTFIPLANGAVEFPRQQLLAVADAQYGNSGSKDGRFNGGAGIVVNAARAARDDDSPGGPQLFKWRVTGKDIGGDAEFPDFTRDQVAILPACIEYCNLRRRGYFFILSTTILCALLSRASALGRAFTAASTSGSVLVS